MDVISAVEIVVGCWELVRLDVCGRGSLRLRGGRGERYGRREEGREGERGAGKMVR